MRRQPSPSGDPAERLVHRSTRFVHERLVAYKVAMELARQALLAARDVRAPWGEVRNQLMRSALAVPRHVAEAAARTSAADRKQRFVVARGECAELAATVETLVAIGALRRELGDGLRSLADRACALLTGLVCREARRA